MLSQKTDKGGRGVSGEQHATFVLASRSDTARVGCVLVASGCSTDGESDLNGTSCDLLSPDPLPKCLTCSHQSPTLAGDPEDTETVRGGEDGARAMGNERENAVSTKAEPFPVAPLNQPRWLFTRSGAVLHKEYSLTVFVPARCYQWQQIPDSPPRVLRSKP